jgi:hypothetical protein
MGGSMCFQYHSANHRTFRQRYEINALPVSPGRVVIPDRSGDNVAGQGKKLDQNIPLVGYKIINDYEVSERVG